MIATRVGSYNQEAMRNWLETKIKPHLRADVSNYARGRLRVWMGWEPSLSQKYPHPTAGLQWGQALAGGQNMETRFEHIIGWKFDYCLITYSGDNAIGIGPHRDASYAAYEAYGLNCVGTSVFKYWNDRNAFGYTTERTGIKQDDPPSHVLELQPGDIVHFNCKNLHSAEPTAGRWGMNFWRRKP